MLTIVGILGAVAFPSTAMAATAPTGGSVSVTPNKVATTVPAGPYTFPITLTNHESTAVTVQLSTSGLSQGTSGNPAFTTPASVPIQVATGGFELQPGQQRSVPVTVTVAPDTAGVFDAVLATFGSARPAQGSLTIHERLAVLVELTGPAAQDPQATVNDITAVGSRKSGHISFSALVRDTGNTRIAPVGTATISSGGQTIATVPLGSQGIVPGSAVTYSGAWNSPTALNGVAQVHIHLDNPAADATSAITFQDGAAPTATASILSVQSAPTAGGVIVTTQLKDTGNTSFPATVSTAEFTGKKYATLAEASAPPLAPGRTVTVEQTVRLSAGEHELTIKALSGSTVLDQRQLAVTVKAPTPILPIVLGIAALVVLGGATTFLLLRRRRAASLVQAV